MELHSHLNAENQTAFEHVIQHLKERVYALPKLEKQSLPILSKAMTILVLR